MAEESDEQAFELCKNSSYQVGGHDQLGALRAEFPSAPEGDGVIAFRRVWGEFLRQVQVELGTLLKTDSVAVLLGAGASVDAGGLLLGSVPKEIEQDLLAAAASDDANGGWLLALYGAAVTHTGSTADIPLSIEAAEKRREDGDPLLPVNVERLLSQLLAWEQAFRDASTELQLAPDPFPLFSLSEVRTCRQQVISALVSRCNLDAPEENDPREKLIKKLVTRPLTLKRVGLFTLNYDRLLEQAADGEGVVLLDGFVGNAKRVFRPDSYDHDLYFPAETTEGRVHRLDRVLHLYKLHGSINWRQVKPSWHDPYGLEAAAAPVDDADLVAIYPTPAKYGDTLLMPYAEVFRRLANTIVRPQATLIVIGYGFGDEHVNAVIRQALAVPSFNLVVVDPDPTNPFVETLAERDDRRIRILRGRFGSLQGFVDHLLPDLSEEQVTRKVVETYDALTPRGKVANDSGTTVGPSTPTTSAGAPASQTKASDEPDTEEAGAAEDGEADPGPEPGPGEANEQ